MLAKTKRVDYEEVDERGVLDIRHRRIYCEIIYKRDMDEDVM